VVSWPKELPSYEAVEHCCNVFFDKVPTFPKMLHRATFFINLQLPPSHPKFPVSATSASTSGRRAPADLSQARPLLHAILSIAANHISETSLGSRAFFPTGTPTCAMSHPESNFDDRSSFDRFIGTARLRSNAQAGGMTPLGRFQLWHRRYAWELLPEYYDHGQKLLQLIQGESDSPCASGVAEVL
jgi:hypothetical protein